MRTKPDIGPGEPLERAARRLGVARPISLFRELEGASPYEHLQISIARIKSGEWRHRTERHVRRLSISWMRRGAGVRGVKRGPDEDQGLRTAA